MKRSYVLVVLVILHSKSSGHILCGDGERCRGTELAEGKMALMFRNFMKTYNKIYKDQREEMQRFKIFAENMEKVRLIQEAEQGSARYGITKFSDLSAEEFAYGGLEPANSFCKSIPFSNPSNNVPETKDWRKEGAVTEVKNQSNCSCCWDFAVTANVESQWFRKSGELIPLAVQELLDCGIKSNNCSGGQIDLAFKDIVKLGLEPEAGYPYTAYKSACTHKTANSVVKIKSCIWLPQNETAMKQYVATNGTVVVLVKQVGLQHYIDGILKPKCDSKSKYHAMLIVGYGIEPNKPYWILKNSWGIKWGEKGYARMYRGENTCRIREYAMSAVV